MKSFSIVLLLLLAFAPASVFSQTDELESLFKNFRHFELREAVEKRKNDDSAEMLFYRGAVANRFNEPEKSDRLLRRYLKKSGKSAAHAAEAYEILADNYTKQFEYGKSADAYRFLLDNYRAGLDAERIKSYENVFGLWNALRAVAPQSVKMKGDSVVQGTRDAARLLNVPVEINGIKENFVFDTGAGLSTISATTARRLGLKIIETEVSVGSSTDIDVKSKLAVAPLLKLGNATLQNVVFLVLDDKALSFPQINYEIRGIIGFPVIKSLGAVSIGTNDQISIYAASPKTTAESNLALQGLTPIVAAARDGRRLSFVFDTGAGSTDFYPPFLKANEAEIIKNQTTVKARVGGAGGFREVAAYQVPEIELEIGGKRARLKPARILTEKTNENSRYYDGNLGQDWIKQFTRLTLDFRAMRISFE